MQKIGGNEIASLSRPGQALIHLSRLRLRPPARSGNEIMCEWQEVSNTALHNFPPTTGLKSKKLEMRTKIKEKSLTPAGFEPTTSGL